MSARDSVGKCRREGHRVTNTDDGRRCLRCGLHESEWEVFASPPAPPRAPLVLVDREEADRENAARRKAAAWMFETREVLGVSLALVAKWAGVKKRAVDRWELDGQGDAREVSRLAAIYWHLREIRALSEGARTGVEPARGGSAVVVSEEGGPWYVKADGKTIAPFVTHADLAAGRVSSDEVMPPVREPDDSQPIGRKIPRKKSTPTPPRQG